jgi:hypothetical protein
VYPKL